MKKLYFIDALRGFAIFGVIMVHVSLLSPDLPDWLYNIVVDGARGVQLFFIISAFTLFYSFSSRTKKEIHPNINYFLRRFFRIAPMFYIGTIFYYFFGETKEYKMGNIISHFTFLHGINPYWINSLTPGGWSIAVEMVFYLFVPFLFLKIKSLKQSIFLTLGTFIFAVILIKLLYNNSLIPDTDVWHTFMYLWFPTQVPIFSMGIVLFFLYKKYNGKILFRNANYIILMSLLLIGAILFIPKIAPVSAYAYPYSFVFVLFAFGLSQYPNKIFVNVFWRYLGKISFSAYLIHEEVIRLISPYVKWIGNKNPTVHFLILFVLVLVITIVLSTITFYLIEKVGIRVGKVLIKKIENRYQTKDLKDKAIKII